MSTSDVPSKSWVDWFAHVSTLVALVASGISLYLANEANRYAKLTYERDSGLILPSLSMSPERGKVFMETEEGIEKATARLSFVNAGKQPIDAIGIRVEAGAVMAGGKIQDIQHVSGTMLHELSPVLQPGRAVDIDVKPDVMESLKGVNPSGNPEDNCIGVIRFHVSARMVDQKSALPLQELPESPFHTHSPSMELRWRPSLLTAERVDMYLKNRRSGGKFHWEQ